MTATRAQARDQMLTLFKTAWDTTGYTALYDDVSGQPPTGNSPWARVTVQHNDGFQATLAGDGGSRRHRRVGFLTAQIFTPSGDGLSTADELGKLVADAYEGQATSGGVWFPSVKVNEVGPDGNWYQTNVVVEFEYDEVK